MHLTKKKQAVKHNCWFTTRIE